jgi:hypothetical protein
MKKIVYFIALAGIIAGCKPKNTATTTTSTQTTTQDTAGLSQFQQWKAQHELATPNQYQQNAVAPAQSAPVTRHRTSTVYTSRSESSNTAKVSKKRGWSHGAKDAVIGGVGGAVIGAVADKKNRGVGGVIGGVVGAAAGYGIGHHKDKKQGRY